VARNTRAWHTVEAFMKKAPAPSREIDGPDPGVRETPWQK